MSSHIKIVLIYCSENYPCQVFLAFFWIIQKKFRKALTMIKELISFLYTRNLARGI